MNSLWNCGAGPRSRPKWGEWGPFCAKWTRRSGPTCFVGSAPSLLPECTPAARNYQIRSSHVLIVTWSYVMSHVIRSKCYLYLGVMEAFRYHYDTIKRLQSLHLLQGLRAYVITPKIWLEHFQEFLLNYRAINSTLQQLAVPFKKYT